MQGCRGEFGKSGKPGRTLCISRYVSGVAILLVESGVLVESGDCDFVQCFKIFCPPFVENYSKFSEKNI